MSTTTSCTAAASEAAQVPRSCLRCVQTRWDIDLSIVGAPGRLNLRLPVEHRCPIGAEVAIAPGVHPSPDRPIAEATSSCYECLMSGALCENCKASGGTGIWRTPHSAFDVSRITAFDVSRITVDFMHLRLLGEEIEEAVHLQLILRRLQLSEPTF